MNAPLLSTSPAPAHAPLAPSSAPRWVQCPGSVAMAARYPEDETPHAKEGTAAHWACAELLHGRQIDAGLIAPNGIVLTDEMCEGADLYFDFVRSCMAETSAIRVEQRIDCPDIHPENWGTPDCWIIDRARRTIDIPDYKFGHRIVEPFENWQLINYAAGVLHAAEITGMEDQAFAIRLHIVQPRGFHRDGPIRTWQMRASDLRAYFNQLASAAAQAMTPEAPCATGEECRYCPARHACPALQRVGFAAFDMAGESVPLELTPDALGRELALIRTAIERLKARETGLTAAATELMKNGQRVPGFALEQGLGRERWAKPLAEVLALGQMLGIELSKPGAITPKQAIKAGVPAEVVRALSETPKGEIKLVPDGQRLSAIFGRAA